MYYKTFHYGDDGINDHGWGCSYRNIQTIISCYKKYYNKNAEIPKIQDILTFFKKNIDINNLKDLWIEPYHISVYLNFFDKKISGNHYVYVTDDNDFSKILKTDILFYLDNNLVINDFNDICCLIKKHFKNTKLPIIIDNGIYSYCFIIEENNNILLIDPHRPNNKVQKKSICFLKKSFWMFFFPRIII